MIPAALVFSAVLLAVAAALRAAGASLVRTPRADALHDAAEGDERAARVAVLLEDRPRLQPALGMVHSATLVAASVPAAWALTEASLGWFTAPALVLLGLVLVLVGDLIPRSWGRRRPRRPAYRFAALLEFAVHFGERAADLIQDDEEEVIEDEEENGHEEEERELISLVLEFTDAVVREVMVPRPDMFVLPASMDVEAALGKVVESGRSRIPVTGDGLDDVVGILYAKDFLARAVVGGEAATVGDVMRPATYVPETKRVSELLREMQKDRVHMAIVIDEFGGTAGLVTIEDILEELVGEIVDEHDVEEPMVIPLEDGGYLIDARMHLDDFEELLEAEVADEDWDTVGGLVLGLAGRVPLEGESFEFDRYLLTAERVQGRRVARVRITAR